MCVCVCVCVLSITVSQMDGDHFVSVSVIAGFAKVFLLGVFACLYVCVFVYISVYIYMYNVFVFTPIDAYVHSLY